MGSRNSCLCDFFIILPIYIYIIPVLSLKKKKKGKKAAFTLNSTKDKKNYCLTTNYLQLQCCQHTTAVNQGSILKYPKSVFTNQHS